jgi:hypothetical protein
VLNEETELSALSCPVDSFQRNEKAVIHFLSLKVRCS